MCVFVLQMGFPDSVGAIADDGASSQLLTCRPRVATGGSAGEVCRLFVSRSQELHVSEC